MIYRESTSYKKISSLIISIIKKTVPADLLGFNNLQVIINNIEQFISMKRF